MVFNFLINKKGLSDVITNVLIILLVIIAIGIIAAFVFPLLRGSVSQAGEAQQCLGVDISVNKCINSSDKMNITIQRGAGSYKLSNAVIIFSKVDGTSESKDVSSTSITNLNKEFGTVIEGFSVGNPKGASIAVKLEGASKSCPRTLEVACS